MIERKLDGVFFRVSRDGKWRNICFSDLTAEEREEVCKNRSGDWFKRLAFHLADSLASVAVVHGQWIGTEYDGYAGGEPVYDKYECSECGNELDTDDPPSYCCDCGAKMDGKEDEDET